MFQTFSNHQPAFSCGDVGDMAIFHDFHALPMGYITRVKNGIKSDLASGDDWQYANLKMALEIGPICHDLPIFSVCLPEDI